MPDVKSIVGGLLSSVSYIIQVKDGCWIVDAGDYSALKSSIHSPVKGILLTHGHFDHIAGLNDLLRDFPEARVFTNRSGLEMLRDAKKNLSRYHDNDFTILPSAYIAIVNDGDMVHLDSDMDAHVISTPGHHPSCITWLIGDSVFTGDAYIPGSKTVTKLPGGNKHQAEESMKLILEISVKRKLYPGHTPKNNK